MENPVICTGLKLEVKFYRKTNGEMPAKDYLEGLPDNVQAKLLALAKYISDEGQIYDKKKFRIVDKRERIWEFKPYQHRFFCFFIKNGKLIITNGYKKEGRKISKNDLNIAIEYKKDYLRRYTRRRK